MVMRSRLRKVMLTIHVTTSVGWLGAAAAVAGLAIVGATSGDELTVRSVYIAMQPIAVFVVVPLSLASLLTGVLQAFGTPWGLVRHYWVLALLALNLIATGVLLLFVQTVGPYTEDQARDATVPLTDLQALGAESFSHAVVAVLALVGAVAVAIFKPWGRTPFAGRTGG